MEYRFKWEIKPDWDISDHNVLLIHMLYDQIGSINDKHIDGYEKMQTEMGICLIERECFGGCYAFDE